MARGAEARHAAIGMRHSIYFVCLSVCLSLWSVRSLGRMGSVRERCQGVSDSVCVYPSTVRAPYSVDQTNQINVTMRSTFSVLKAPCWREPGRLAATCTTRLGRPSRPVFDGPLSVLGAYGAGRSLLCRVRQKLPRTDARRDRQCHREIRRTLPSAHNARGSDRAVRASRGDALVCQHALLWAATSAA